jgi:citrate synthase
VLFILHADHEQNCSTNAMRSIGSSHVDPYSALAGAAAALYGPLHGGANEAVLRMLGEIGSKDNVPAIHQARQGRRGATDGLRPPRLQELRPARQDHQADRRRGVRGDGQEPAARHRAGARAHRARRRLLRQRKLYPNVDFYSGIIYQAMGFPVDMFPVLFAIPRTAGWLAQWEEMLLDPSRRSPARGRSRHSARAMRGSDLFAIDLGLHLIERELLARRLQHRQVGRRAFERHRHRPLAAAIRAVTTGAVLRE